MNLKKENKGRTLNHRIVKRNKIKVNKKIMNEDTLCGKPHNNADETCLECEVIKKNL